jgi:hypothetical protein
MLICGNQLNTGLRKVNLHVEINEIRKRMVKAIRHFPVNSVFLSELSKNVDAVDGLEKYLDELEKSNKYFSSEGINSHLSVIYLNFSSKAFLYDMMDSIKYAEDENAITSIVNNMESEIVVDFYKGYTPEAIVSH